MNCKFLNNTLMTTSLLWNFPYIKTLNAMKAASDTGLCCEESGHWVVLDHDGIMVVRNFSDRFWSAGLCWFVGCKNLLSNGFCCQGLEHWVTGSQGFRCNNGLWHIHNIIHQSRIGGGNTYQAILRCWRLCIHVGIGNPYVGLTFFYEMVWASLPSMNR